MKINKGLVLGFALAAAMPKAAEAQITQIPNVIGALPGIAAQHPFLPLSANLKVIQASTTSGQAYTRISLGNDGSWMNNSLGVGYGHMKHGKLPWMVTTEFATDTINNDRLVNVSALTIPGSLTFSENEGFKYGGLGRAGLMYQNGDPTMSRFEVVAGGGLFLEIGGKGGGVRAEATLDYVRSFKSDGKSINVPRLGLTGYINIGRK